MKKLIIISITVIMIVVTCFIAYDKVSAVKNKNDVVNISLLCNEFSQYSDDSASQYFVIYLDIDACLTCTDYIPSWIELEKELPKYGGQLLIYTNHQDSLDVAIAMELEGLNSIVHVLDDNQIKQLNPSNKRTPIKILFDSNCQPLLFIEPLGSENEAKRFYKKLLNKIRYFS